MSESLQTAVRAAFAEPEAALYIAVSPKTLSNWRSLGIGPQYVRYGAKRGGRIAYRKEDLDRYLAEHVVGAA